MNETGMMFVGLEPWLAAWGASSEQVLDDFSGGNPHKKEALKWVAFEINAEDHERSTRNVASVGLP